MRRTDPMRQRLLWARCMRIARPKAAGKRGICFETRMKWRSGALAITKAWAEAERGYE